MPYDVGLPNYRGSGNVIYDSGDYPAVLRHALEMSDYERLAKECRRARDEGRLLGLGVACYVELTGVGPFEGATVRADAAGTHHRLHRRALARAGARDDARPGRRR